VDALRVEHGNRSVDATIAARSPLAEGQRDNIIHYDHVAPASAQQPKPNIVFIMGDDIGWFNVGAYHRGMMSGKTPNLDRLAAQGMMFTDYYAEASCTAGRANFITGELPIRTGMTTVGQAGAEFQPRPQRLRRHSRAWATPPASSARTILAI
jgi:hypothetical protein